MEKMEGWDKKDDCLAEKNIDFFNNWHLQEQRTSWVIRESTGAPIFTKWGFKTWTILIAQDEF